MTGPVKRVTVGQVRARILLLNFVLWLAVVGAASAAGWLFGGLLHHAVR